MYTTSNQSIQCSCLHSIVQQGLPLLNGSFATRLWFSKMTDRYGGVSFVFSLLIFQNEEGFYFDGGRDEEEFHRRMKSNETNSKLDISTNWKNEIKSNWEILIPFFIPFTFEGSSQAVVNFTNILHVAFLYETFAQKLFCTWSKGYTFYWRKEVGANALIKCWWNWLQLWSISPTFCERTCNQ